jgi:hypothetical protein
MNDVNQALEAKKDLDLKLDEMHLALDPKLPAIVARPQCGWCREGCWWCREGCWGCGCREGCRGCREGCHRS